MDPSIAHPPRHGAPEDQPRSAADQPAFVGRQHHLARLGAALADARAGRPRVVLIDGPLGIGKTALAYQLARRANVASALLASGDEAETSLEFGVVDQLLAHAATSRRPKLRLPDSGQGNPLAVGASLIDLLSQLQEHGTVLVVVDDAHWADTPSLKALTFALRRLHADQVLALVTTRDICDSRLPEGLRRLLDTPVGIRLRLGGLSAAEVRELTRQLRGITLTSRDSERLREHTGGNPLHVCGLLRELPETVLRGSGALPAPRAFTMLVLHRLAGCAQETRQLVLAAATLGISCGLALAGQLAGIDDPLVPLEEAIAAGLLEERNEGVLGFPHPLVRAAIWRDLSPSVRAWLHSRAACLVDDPWASLRHRIAAAGGRRDAALADEVAVFAHRQAAAGRQVAAAELLRDSARLALDASDSERHLLDAAGWLLQAGEIAEAETLHEELQGCADGPRRRCILGYLAAASGRLEEGARLLEAAWAGCDRSQDPNLAARIAAGLARISALEAPGRAAARWSYRALRLAPGAAESGNALDLLLLSLCLAGHPGLGLALAARLPAPMPEGHPSALAGIFGRGALHLWSDRLDAALADLSAVATAYRQHGPVDLAIISHNALAEAQFRSGDWDAAIALWELGIALADDAAQRWLSPYLHARAAFPHIGRGHWERADECLRLASAGTLGGQAMLWVHEVEAFSAFTRNDPDGVVAALKPVLSVTGDAPAHFGNQPGVLEWRDMYAEALTALGRFHEADMVLCPLERQAARHARRSTLVTAAVARGRLEAARGQAGAAEDAFRAGLANAQGLARPFTIARLELAYGGFLRRAGRRAAAAGHLSGAHELLSSLGARPWLARCQQELRSCGRARSSRHAVSRIGLTSQELAVARLAASGMSNQQIATRLVVSVKTIEYHLGKVYPKLGITSRTQLAARLGSD